MSARRQAFFPSRTPGSYKAPSSWRRDPAYAYTDKKAIEAVKIIGADPDIDEVHYNAGGSAQASVNAALRTLEDGRTASATDIINRLRPQLANIVGAQVILQAMQDITMGGRSSRAQYQYTLYDGDLDELNEWTPQAGRRAAKSARAEGRLVRPTVAGPCRQPDHRP